MKFKAYQLLDECIFFTVEIQFISEGRKWNTVIFKGQIKPEVSEVLKQVSSHSQAGRTKKVSRQKPICKLQKNML